MPDQYKHDYFDRRLTELKRERESFDTHYKDLARFIQPRQGRFYTSDHNKGDRRWNDIVNSRATQALRVAVAGMFNGIMSPSRPWLMLETDDPELRDHWSVRPWFHEVSQRMLRILDDTNLYNMAPVMLRELLLFGTGCMHDIEDQQDLARFYTHTVGSYWIAQDDRFVVNTVVHETELTVEQMVSKFSENGEVNPKLSQRVKDLYARGELGTWVPVVHFTEPNPEARPGSVRKNERPFRSVYYERGHHDRNVLLSESGFYEFPYFVPRWDVTGEDFYGTDCPGITALGDVRQIQLEERRKAQGIDKMISPPLHGPAALRHATIGNVPGGGTFYDSPGTNQGLRPVYEVRLPIQELAADIEKVEGRINEAFFVPLFQAITAMDGVQPRNQLELQQRHQERLLQLGPVLERMFGEYLKPLVYRTFKQMERAGLIPDAPPVLQGRPLRPRFISPLAMAQQAVSTGNIDRLAGFVSGLAGAGFEGAIEKFDAEQAVDEYGSMIGAPPDLIVSDEVVAQRRQQRQQQQAAAQALESGQAAANIAKTAGDTKVTDESLAGILNQQSQPQNQ